MIFHKAETSTGYFSDGVGVCSVRIWHWGGWSAPINRDWIRPLFAILMILMIFTIFISFSTNQIPLPDTLAMGSNKAPRIIGLWHWGGRPALHYAAKQL